MQLLAGQLVTIDGMEFLTSALRVKDRNCLVAGSSDMAIQQALQLCSHGANVTLVGHPVSVPVNGNLVVEPRDFTADDLTGCWLVIAGCDNRDDNNTILQLCNAKQIFCYCPDDPQKSSWHHQSAAANTQEYTDTASPTEDAQDAGLVSLVGAGPGDPELLTLRALRLIQAADAIVYDRLVSEPILALCNPHAEFIYAGKEKANHTLPQDSINHLLTSLARKYSNVVRLKGGDPFIFGRGGEEIETLADQQIPFQVVPGITAASGCAAFAGIPLTHRDHAQSCVFVTGHLRNGEINLNWHQLTDPQQTIVVYMGLTGLDMICESLIHHGHAAHTPAALVQQGTQPQQRVLSSTLEGLPALVAQNNVTAPTLLIIGGVVSLRDKLAWFNPENQYQ